MKKLLLILLCLPLLFSSCQYSKMREIEGEVSYLKKEIVELKSEKIDLEAQINQLTSLHYETKEKLNNAQAELQMFQLSQENRIVERMTRYGYTRVYGTDNIIEFLNDNYCTHFDYVVDRATRDRTMRSPIIYGN